MTAPPRKAGGMSLYADLLGGDKQTGGSTISGAPVRYDVKKDDEEAAQRRKDGTVT
jgi:hypothetical protein